MSSWQPVIDYWFGQQDPPEDNVKKRWFSGGEATDNEIRSNFEELHKQITGNGKPEDWHGTPLAELAAIIIVDQFSRNLYRGSALAFKWDATAATWSEQGWANGLFDQLSECQQAFSVMPLIHTENPETHALAIRLFERLAAQSHNPDTIITGFLSSAKDHQAIIAKFGRYPHRNSVMNRTSTAAETAYLNDGGKRFGQ